MKEIRLILVRHGETALNAEHRFQGRTDPPLSARGRQQASALRRQFAPWLDHADLRVFSSDRLRARQTAALALDGWDHEPAIEPRLQELDFGCFDALTHDECASRYGRRYLDWLRDPFAHPPPGGERVQQLERRLSQWAGECAASGASCVVAFTHGGPVRILLAWARRIPFALARNIDVPPGSLFVSDLPRIPFQAAAP